MSFRSKLVGTWHLLSFKLVDSKGQEVAQPFTENVKGSLVYSSDGYMSAIVASPEAKRWGKWNDPSPEEALVAAKLINSYTGKFFLNEIPGNKQLVFHEIRISIPPNLEGATQKRNVEIFESDSGLRMTISVDDEVEWFGHRAYLLLQWRKEGVNDATGPNSAVEALGDR
jgi:hypothetical protein